MTDTEIEAFLAVYRTHSFSEASRDLFVSQSSLSARIKTLERELSCELFDRRRGMRSVTPTDAGERLYSLALEYIHLVNKMRSVGQERDTESRSLRVSTINSIGSLLFTSIYDRFMHDFPSIVLQVDDWDTAMARTMLERKQLDLAFTIDPISSGAIVSKPVFVEPFTCVCGVGSTYPSVVSLDDLNCDDEVYTAWTKEFEHWHAAQLRMDSIRIRVEIVEQIRHFVSAPQRWAFVPESLALRLVEDQSARIMTCEFNIPDRTIYCSRQIHPVNTGDIDRFVSCMRDELLKLPYIRVVDETDMQREVDRDTIPASK